MKAEFIYSLIAWLARIKSGFRSIANKCANVVICGYTLLRAAWQVFWVSLYQFGVKPVLPLLPWLILAAFFALVLDSGQGKVLAKEIEHRRDNLLAVGGCIVVGYFVTLVGAALAQIAASASASMQDFAQTDSKTRRTAILAIRAAWVAAVSMSMGALLLRSVGSPIVVWTVALLAGVSLGLAVWLVVEVVGTGFLMLRALRFVHSHRIVFSIICMGLALSPLLMGAIAVQRAPMSLAAPGPLLTVLVGFSSVGTLLSCVLYIVPVCLDRWWLGILVLLFVQGWELRRSLLTDVENPLLRDRRAAISESQKSDQSCSPRVRSFEDQIQGALAPSSDDLSSGEFAKTDYLISAEGGGIRAAYWTAMGLAILDEQSKGEISHNTVLLSGVSGGSLGIAAWAGAQEARSSFGERVQLLDRFLGADFLSPLVGGFLFLDLPRNVVGPIWFRTTRDQVFEKAIADWWAETAGTDFFYRPLMRPCMKGFSTVPALFFNATEMQTGSYAPLSPGLIDTWPDSHDGPRSSFRFADTTLASVTMAQAVHVSARFPYLSPAAIVGLDVREIEKRDSEWRRQLPPDARGPFAPPEKQHSAPPETQYGNGPLRTLRAGVLVDGGYFDNTGLVPVLSALSVVHRMRTNHYPGALLSAGYPDALVSAANRTRFVSLHFANDTGRGCVKLPDDWKLLYSRETVVMMSHEQPDRQCSFVANHWEAALHFKILDWLLTPPLATLSVREGHSVAELEEFQGGSTFEDPRIQLSVDQEIFEGYGPKFAPFAAGSSFMLRPDPYKWAATPQSEIFAHLPEVTANAVQQNAIPAERAQAWMDDWRRWDREVREKVNQIPCQFDVLELSVPLGWTLSGENRALLTCFARRAVQRTGILVHPHPRALLAN